MEEKTKKKEKKRAPQDSSELSMTPMIDVTFLLLIFFMLQPFKSFEGKLSAYLPKDKGKENYEIDLQPDLPAMVVLTWNAPRKQCRVTVGNVFCGYDLTGIKRARRKVMQLCSAGTDRAEIDAGGDVHMAWIVQALNMLIQTGITEINFSGSAAPLAG